MRRSVSAVIGVGSEIGKEYIGQISMKTLVSRTWFSASRQAKARNRSSNGWKDENRSMANETLIAKLELNLRQSRAARTRLAARWLRWNRKPRLSELNWRKWTRWPDKPKQRF